MLRRLLFLLVFALSLSLSWSSSLVAEEDLTANDVAAGQDNSALIAKVRASLATIKVSGRDGDQIGMGTGFVIDADGLIATAFHVISEGRPITVELSSGRKLPVISIEASDRSGDLAIVRVDIEGKPLDALPLADAETIVQGTRVMAFGNPLGLRDSVVAGNRVGDARSRRPRIDPAGNSDRTGKQRRSVGRFQWNRPRHHQHEIGDR